jgi:hypothetical protein
MVDGRQKRFGYTLYFILENSQYDTSMCDTQCQFYSDLTCKLKSTARHKVPNELALWLLADIQSILLGKGPADRGANMKLFRNRLRDLVSRLSTTSKPVIDQNDGSRQTTTLISKSFMTNIVPYFLTL